MILERRMQQIAIVDTRLFSSDDQEWLERTREYGRAEGVQVEFRQVRQRGRMHDEDLVALVGLGVSAAALFVAYLQLRRTPKEQWTRKKLVDEIDAYLRLHGVTEYRFLIENGFDNLIARNGLPCIIGVEIADQRRTRLYLGVTDNCIQIAAVEYDHRVLP
jgi:hypothetical protein